MKLLLDTHALLWWWKDDARLSKRAVKAIADEDNTVLVSAASAWEIATKQDFGSIAFDPGRARLLPPEREKLARVVALTPLAVRQKNSPHRCCRS